MSNELKVLMFEGVGWEKANSSIKSGVGNCAIRTRIKNNDGRIIYFEIHGIENNICNMYPYEIMGFVDHCYYCDIEEDNYNSFSPELASVERLRFQYSKERILKFVNENLNCSYADIKIIEDRAFCIHNIKEAIC